MKANIEAYLASKVKQSATATGKKLFSKNEKLTSLFR
jgi:hypothetical protein